MRYNLIFIDTNKEKIMFNKKNLDINYTKKIMNWMVRLDEENTRQRRRDNLEKITNEFAKKPSFNKKLMNQKLSPTSKSPVRSFKRISERKSNDKWDINNIINELEND